MIRMSDWIRRLRHWKRLLIRKCEWKCKGEQFDVGYDTGETSSACSSSASSSTYPWELPWPFMPPFFQAVPRPQPNPKYWNLKKKKKKRQTVSFPLWFVQRGCTFLCRSGTLLWSVILQIQIILINSNFTSQTGWKMNDIIIIIYFYLQNLNTIKILNK